MVQIIGTCLLFGGLILAAAAQLAIAFYAFAGNPLQGLACFIVPLYVWVYARKHKVSRIFMACWFVAVFILALGVIMVS